MFYPLSKITPNLFTSGNEYFFKETQLDYKGYYYSTYDDRFFTDKSPSDASKELLKYSSFIIKSENFTASTYNNLTNTQVQGTISTAQHTPTPTEADYKKGVIQRYVTKRVNGDNSTIQEVNQETFNSLKTNPLYILSEIPWVITGKLEDTTLADGLVVPGVVSKNYQEVSKSKIDLLTFFKNFGEFSK
jgi:hypothetical protein